MVDIDTNICVYNCVNMATNLSIDETLLTEAKKLGHFRTKRDTVNSALEEFIQRRKQVEILQLFNTIEYDKSYDYKKLRMKQKPKQ